MSKFLLYLAGSLLIASTALAGEKKLMHCFAFTAQENATPADWDAFYKATNELPKKIKGSARCGMASWQVRSRLANESVSMACAWKWRTSRCEKTTDAILPMTNGIKPTPRSWCPARRPSTLSVSRASPAELGLSPAGSPSFRK